MRCSKRKHIDINYIGKSRLTSACDNRLNTCLLITLQYRGGGVILSKVKNREEFEGGLEKRKGKGGKEEKKIPQKIHKNREEF